MRVGVTRPADDAGSLADALAGRGMVPVLLPVLRREPVPDALSDLGDGFDLLLLTSPAAAHSCRDLRVVPARVGCVGPGTAAAARAALGDVPMVVPAIQRGDALIEALGPLNGQRVLWVRGAHVTPATVQALDEAGADWTGVVAYRTIPCPEAARARLAEEPVPDLVTLTSPRVARAWSEVGVHVPSVCIGPTTADAARACGLPVVAVARTHDLDGLVTSCADLADAG